MKRCHWFFHNNFYKYARIFMIFGPQLWKLILIILVDLLRCVPCTSLTWWRNVDVTEIMPFTMHVTLSQSCCRDRDAKNLSLQGCCHPIRQIWIRRMGYPSREGLLFADPWCEGVERTSAELVETAGPCTPSSRQQLRSGVVVWMRVFAWMVDILNINFEPLTFCCVLFVSSVLVDRHKHVQSANIVWNVLLLCLTLSHNECVAGNSYASDFGILLSACARKITKIRQYL